VRGALALSEKPIAELSLNEEMPLAGVAVSGSDIGVVAGA
jgi:hypothetical protein